MAKKHSPLRAALDKQKGVTKHDYQVRKQWKHEKEVAKKKRKRNGDVGDDDTDALDDQIQNTLAALRANREEDAQIGKVQESVDDDGGVLLDDDEYDEDEEQLNFARLVDSDSDSESEIEFSAPNELIDKATEEEDDIPLSDVEFDDAGSGSDADIVPHQRLTINNTSALLKALKSFQLPTSMMAFSEHQSITTPEQVSIPDVEDDLNRELSFYAQSLSAVKEARTRLTSEGVPFTRPSDYFAEMVKSDEHMGKIKAKLVEDAASKKAAADARRQRDLKKFGKQVQQERLKERAKAKRDMLDKVNILKRKRQGAGLDNPNEADMFDVALEDAAATDRREKVANRRKQGDGPNKKRRLKDQKFGFGGKKRHIKSNDAESSSDMRGFPGRRMKGKSSKRPGKSRRATMRS